MTIVVVVTVTVVVVVVDLLFVHICQQDFVEEEQQQWAWEAHVELMQLLLPVVAIVGSFHLIFGSEKS